MLIERQEVENFARANYKGEPAKFNQYLEGVIDGYNFFKEHRVKVIEFKQRRNTKHDLSMNIPFDWIGYERQLLDYFISQLRQKFLRINHEQDGDIVTTSLTIKCVENDEV